ncbi:MAG: alpha/beta fold hydrolase [Proteobacteria bacterium]|nr:alpha/beta fold hydrolase [Pseudomonadota bacterium]
MKKYLLACLFLLTMGCAGTPAQPENASETAMNITENAYQSIPDVDKAMERSDLAIHRFRTQNWDKLRELFTSESKKYITGDMLLDVWKKDISPSGAFEKIVYRLPIVQKNTLAIQTLVKFENNYIQFTVSNASNGELDGIYEMPIKTDAINTCPKDCTAEALQIFDMFRARKWDDFHGMCDERLKNKLEISKLDDIRNETEKLGRFISAVNITPGEKPRTLVYQSLFENGMLALTYEFTEDGKLISFYYKYKLNQADQKTEAASEPEAKPDLYAPASSELWTETAISVTADADMPLKGLLTVPKNTEKPPVVILVHGSGCNDMNETLLSNHPFIDLAHGLADKGIAVLRYHKRCFEYADKIGTDLSGAIEPHVLDDVDAAIDMMQKDSRVDGSHIFVLGHSMGGYLLPYIASRHPELKGGIAMAGSLRGLEDGLYVQLIETFKEVMPENAFKEEELKLKAEYQELKNLSADTPDDKQLLHFPAKFWKSLQPTRGELHIDKVTQPMLVLQAEKDVQVYPQHEYPAWQEAAQKHANIECHLIPNVNHLFMPVKTEGPERSKFVGEYAVPAHIVPEVIDTIAEFVKRK